jgi:hypothetical protein
MAPVSGELLSSMLVARKSANIVQRCIDGRALQLLGA